jgi:tetratricopeptide (TPR) repeat protein
MEQPRNGLALARILAEAMKLSQALFKEPWQAYQVVTDVDDDGDSFSDWELQPLMGPTLAPEDVDDVFQGLFIIAAQAVSTSAAPQSCYMDLTLPERIAEHHFLLTDGRITRRRGLHPQNATVIPAIGIEALGVYKLYFAKQNPSAGINILKSGMEQARDRSYLAYDLAFLLRDEKRYGEAIDALTVFLKEHSEPHLAHILYNERSRMYAALGQADKAGEDRRLAALALNK